jgi:hypothetical protein
MQSLIIAEQHAATGDSIPQMARFLPVTSVTGAMACLRAAQALKYV